MINPERYSSEITIPRLWEWYHQDTAADKLIATNTIGRMWREFAEQIPALPEGAKVLDLGCGSGFVMEFLLSRNPAITVDGVDISPVALTQAKQRLAQIATAAGRFNLFEGDVTRGLPEKNGNYDLVTANFLLQYFKLNTQQELLIRIHNVINRGGMILDNTFLTNATMGPLAGRIMTPGDHETDTTRQNIAKIFPMAKTFDTFVAKGEMQYSTADEALQAHQVAGFDDVRIVHEYRYPDIPAMLDPCGIIILAGKS